MYCTVSLRQAPKYDAGSPLKGLYIRSAGQEVSRLYEIRNFATVHTKLLLSQMHLFHTLTKFLRSVITLCSYVCMHACMQ